MKRLKFINILITAIATGGLTACSSDDNPAVTKNNEITISPGMSVSVESRDYDAKYTPMTQPFFCEAFKSGATSETRGQKLFGDRWDISKGNWDNGPHYWPLTGNYDFFAVSDFGNECSKPQLDPNNDKYLYYIYYNQQDCYKDLLVGNALGYNYRDRTVSITMLHALACIKIRIVNQTEHYNIAFDKIEILNAYTGATYYYPLWDTRYSDPYSGQYGPENYPQYYNALSPYYTGTWKWHGSPKTINVEMSDEFKAYHNPNKCEVGLKKNNEQHIWIINDTNPFFLIPHSDLSNYRIRFTVRAWDHSIGGWSPNPFYTNGIVECNFAPAGMTMMMSTIYTITYTFNNPDTYISDPISVGCYSSTTWDNWDTQEGDHVLGTWI